MPEWPSDPASVIREAIGLFVAFVAETKEEKIPSYGDLYEAGKAASAALEVLQSRAAEHAGIDATNDRILQAHSAMPAEAIGSPHRVYKQGHDERCYICTLLARVREVEAERDKANEAKTFAQERLAHALIRIGTAEATVARQAETLRDALSWIENYPLNLRISLDGNWNALADEIRAVLASPEAAATEPQRCKHGYRVRDDDPTVQACIAAAALPAVDAATPEGSHE